MVQCVTKENCSQQILIHSYTHLYRSLSLKKGPGTLLYGGSGGCEELRVGVECGGMLFNSIGNGNKLLKKQAVLVNTVKSTIFVAVFFGAMAVS